MALWNISCTVSLNVSRTESNVMTIQTLASYHSADQETRAEILSYIAWIPDDETRMIFVLHFLRGLSYAKTAKEVGYLTKSCVYKRVKRYVKKHEEKVSTISEKCPRKNVYSRKKKCYYKNTNWYDYIQTMLSMWETY